MKIGEVAGSAGVSVDRIHTAKALQELGFTLDEVVDAWHAHDAGDAARETERWRLEAVVARLDERIEQLQRVRRNAAAGPTKSTRSAAPVSARFPCHRSKTSTPGRSSRLRGSTLRNSTGRGPRVGKAEAHRVPLLPLRSTAGSSADTR